MTNLAAAVSQHNTLKVELLRLYPSLAEDEQALMDTLEGISSLDEAIAAVVERITEYETMAEAIGLRIKSLTDRKRRLEGSADTMRAAILEAMQSAGLPKVTLPEATVSVSGGSKSVVVTDDRAAVEAGYGEWLPKVDKAAVKAALGAGALPFATLSNGAPRLTIRRS